jgi:hypothetical protein
VKIKEPTRKHEIPEAGESWMKRKMRPPFRVMFLILVVCIGFAWVIFSVVSGIVAVKNNINQRKIRVASEWRRAEDEKRTARDELRRAKAEYAEAKAELEAVRAWAEAELIKSNDKLQAVVNSVTTVDGGLRIPEKEAQKYIYDAMEVCERRGREIHAVEKAALLKARRVQRALIEAKRKALDAGVEEEEVVS